MKSLHILGFQEVLEAAAKETAFPPAREAVRTAVPEIDPDRLAEMLTLVREAADCLQRGMDLPGAGAIAADSILATLRQTHSMLTGPDLVQLRELCAAASKFRRFERPARKSAPHLADLCAGFVSLGELFDVLRGALEDDGRVRDAASPELQSVRKRLASRERERQKAIEGITRRLFNAGRLQENFHTIRNDRYVVPVKAGEHTRVQGILHDVSQSGETYFIEPAEMVQISNELAQLRAQEEVEVARVLRRLTDEARGWLPDIESNVGALTRLENVFARARFGERHGWHMCEVGTRRRLMLTDCHHPLLAMRRPEESQPNSFALDASDTAVVISGPNAGGKTTLLKMVGLIAALAHAAMPMPLSPDSHVPHLSGIFADIGDEQDVAAGLSSFSAHVRNLTGIMKAARKGALVLLDEIGGSTDPEEGAALATGVIETFAARGALVLATSHYTVLKEWANRTPNARNVSFYLDQTTHKPTFALMMDVPGTSEAFVVAREEGMPADALDRAQKNVNPERRKLNDLLVDVQRKDTELRRLRDEFEELSATLEQERAEYEERQAELRREKRSFRGDLTREKEAELRELRSGVERLIAQQPSKEALEEARRTIGAMQERAAEDREEIEREEADEIKFVAHGRLRPGQRLKIRDWNEPAEVLAVDHKKKSAQVRIGTLEMTVRFRDIEGAMETPKKNAAAEAGADSMRKRMRGVTVNASTDSAALELDLHGKRVEEALELLDRHLNAAVLANLPHVRILHGVGTGALRQAVHDFLKTHPLVKSVRAGSADEGGHGCTTAYFK